MTKLTGTRNPTRKDELGTESSPLLPTQNGPKEPLGGGGGSSWGGVFNLWTTIIGAGIMALPAVMKVLGLGVGIAMVVLVAVFSEASLEMLVRFSSVAKAGSYGSVMGLAFGSGGRILLQVVCW